MTYGIVGYSGSLPSGPRGWNNAKVGAGGLITGIDIAPDGTVVARADVFGGYIYNRTAPNPGNAGGAGVWQQLITTTSLASAAALIATPLQAADGLYEIRIAPSNSQIIYIVYLGFVWISTNQGATWTQTSFTQDTTMAGNSTGERYYKYKMAVDPINPDVVYLSTYQNGCFKTLNGTTSATWSAISGVPSNDSYRIGCVAIDPSSSNSSSPTRKSIVYVAVSGSGLYKSTDGGGTFSSVAGGPGTSASIMELQVSSNGTVFAIDFVTSKVWRLVGSTWTDITPVGGGGNWTSVSINPSNADNVIAWSYNNGGRETTTATSGTVGGGMWAAINGTISMTAADTPMIGTLSSTFFTAGMGTTLWDPTDSTKLWCSTNQGVWKITYPLPTAPTPVVFNSVSAGLEEVVANDIVVPPGSFPLFLGWDVGVALQTNLNKYALAQGWYTGSFLSFGAGGDYASSDPTFVCAVVHSQNTGAVESGFSHSSGAAGTWQAFASEPSDGLISGSIAASTPNEMIYVQSNAGQPWYTANQGAAWATISGLPSDGWGFAYYLKRHIVAADRVNIGTFYLQNAVANSAPGTYVVSNGGATVEYHANTIDAGDNSRLRAVPGNAGHLFFTSGPSGGAGKPASDWPHSQLFYYAHYTPGSPGTLTWADVGNLSGNNFTIREVWDFGFGAPKPGGGGYPVIYIYGFVAAGSSPPPSGSTPAFWKSEDAGVTWVQIGSQFPLGWPDYVAAVNGDMNIYGRCYAGFYGSGWIYLAP